METITIQTTVSSDLDTAWKLFTTPEHIMKWNHASDDWACDSAENNPQTGGIFRFHMFAKDGSAAFDFAGKYTNVVPLSLLAYTIDDGRKVETRFSEVKNGVRIETTCEIESENTKEKQRRGWQAILDSFKKYHEENYHSDLDKAGKKL